MHFRFDTSFTRRGTGSVVGGGLIGEGVAVGGLIVGGVGGLIVGSAGVTGAVAGLIVGGVVIVGGIPIGDEWSIFNFFGFISSASCRGRLEKFWGRLVRGARPRPRFADELKRWFGLAMVVSLL